MLDQRFVDLHLGTSVFQILPAIARVIEAARNLRSNDDQRLALAKLEGLVLGLVVSQT